jgi:hypothetical protein
MNSSGDEGYPQAPDLQEWVEKYGGYQNIPWPEWDAAMTRWQAARRRYAVGYVNEPSSEGAHKARRGTRK